MPEKMPDGERKKNIPDPFNSMMNAMNDFFSERGHRGFLESMDDFFTPRQLGGFPVELKETEKEYIVTAKLPGVKKELIEIDILPQQITISVEQSESITQENKKTNTFYKQEGLKRSMRSIPFYKPIDSKKVEASYQDGMLTITVPKVKGKKIDIQ